jgi:hypothetical protein
MRPSGIDDAAADPGTSGSSGGERTAAVKEAFLSLERAVRAAGMYAADHEVPRQFQADFSARIRAAVESFGEIPIDVRARSLALGGAEVYAEEARSEGAVFRLYRDGVRRLFFGPGLQDDEVGRFVGVLRAAPGRAAHFDADAVTLLWDAGLERIRYVVVEMLAEGDDPKLEPLRELMNGIIDAAASARLPPGYVGRKPVHAVHVSLQAAASVTSEQIAAAAALDERSGSVVVHADEGGDRWVRELQARLADPDVPVKFGELLHRGLAESLDHPAPTALAAADLTADLLMDAGRTADLLRLLRLFRELGSGHPRSAETSRRLIETLLGGGRVDAALQRFLAGGDDRQALAEALAQAPAEAAPALVAAAAAEPPGDARETLAEIARRLAATRPGVLAPCLLSADPAQVRLACGILLRLDAPDAFDTLAGLGAHPDPNQRIAMLRATQGARTPAVREARLALVQDEVGRVRAEAERILLQHGEPALIDRLRDRLRTPAFEGSSPEEKQRICTLLGGARDADAVAWFVDRLEHVGVLSARTHQETCAAAARGLGATGDPAHAARLEAAAARWTNPKAVRTACGEALAMLRRGGARLTAPPAAARPGLDDLLRGFLDGGGKEPK